MAEPNAEEAGGDLVKVGTIQHPALAERARSRLAAAGIEATLQADPAIPAPTDLSLAGQVAILVAPGQQAAAARILDELADDSGVPPEEKSGGPG